MADKDALGRAGEMRAVRYLQEAGYAILDRNWRCAEGEIDIVAAAGGAIVVVEVKTRRTGLFGHPFEAIDERKRLRLWRLAAAWRREHPAAARGRVLRVDVVGITGADPDTAVLEHLEDLR